MSTTSLTLEDDDLRGVPLDERLRRIEAAIIAAALEETRGNKSRAAELLGVKRSTLGDRITRCGLGSAPASMDVPTL